MHSSNIFVGALAFAAGAVNAGPCRPRTATSGAADTTTIATSSVTESISASTHSLTFATSSTYFTEVTTTVTASETFSTGTTDTLTSSDSFSTDTATITATESTDLTIATGETTTTTAEATTTSTEAAPIPTFILRAIGSNDPSLAPVGGMGFTELESFRGSDYVFYLDFTSNVGSTQTFTINEETGEVRALNGPGRAAGESGFYSTFSGLASASYVNISTREFAVSQGGEAMVCNIAQGNGYEYLQCNWGQEGVADFWTCAHRLNLVRPGDDFTSQCRDASTSYKIPIIQVIRV
ncbi:hypothetical protein ACHAPJ_013185 [Fusarium lateritium]